MKYINVTVDNKSRFADNLFTYSAGFDLEPGDLVNVPFGSHDTPKKAIVCTEVNDPDCPPDRIKPVTEVLRKSYLPEEAVKTALWMKQRYGIKYHDAFRCFIAEGRPPKPGKEKEPYKDIKGNTYIPEKLTGEQQSAFDKIRGAIENNEQRSFLLWGVTSSGKTEVYMRAIRCAVDQGKTAIMLVPEISLTGRMIEDLAGRFGKERIAVLHSRLTVRERYDEWERIRQGKADIVIGARMAVFAPLENIGLIVMDEEQEPSYKADMTPKYDTVDIALKRVIHYNGVLLLGSATPSVVSYYRARQGIYELLTLTERFNGTPLPKVMTADMREELRAGNNTVFSRLLYGLMKEELASGRQIILLQNRRGYSNFVSCRECGNVMKCPECGISLTYHKTDEKLICHYCGRAFPVPETCPVCGSSYIRHFGIGTEQVEEAVKKFFPEAVTARLDTDSIKNRRDMDRIINDFAGGRTNVLVGTQLAAKGLDFDNVGLVGIIAADTGLNIPDYRSAERTFQLVTQAAGRAGRRERQGAVVIQTYEPDNYALTEAAEHDYEDFYRQEIKLRALMDYPPYTDLIMVSFTAEDEDLAFGCAGRAVAFIEEAMGKEWGGHILGPRRTLNFKSKDTVRAHILVKCPKGDRNRFIYTIENFNKNITDKRVKCSTDIDVNPYSAY